MEEELIEEVIEDFSGIYSRTTDRFITDRSVMDPEYIHHPARSNTVLRLESPKMGKAVRINRTCILFHPMDMENHDRPVRCKVGRCRIT